MLFVETLCYNPYVILLTIIRFGGMLSVLLFWVDFPQRRSYIRRLWEFRDLFRFFRFTVSKVQVINESQRSAADRRRDPSRQKNR